MTLKLRSFLLVMSLVIFSIIFSLLKGSTSSSLYQLIYTQNDQLSLVFLKLRLPRTLTAFVSGGLLALAGSLMQLLLQNPLADPYVLGVSGGAALCTLLIMLFGISEYWLLGGAWFGSLAAIILIFMLAKKRRFQAQTLLLSGIALSCGFSACINFILIISPDVSLHSMLFWLSGDLNDAQMPIIGSIVLLVGFCICMMLAPGLNILSRGDLEARALGLASEKYRIVLFLLSSLFTACAVTQAGCIGFIGLIIPHITRITCGYDYRILLPISLLLGGSLLTIADTLARVLFAPQQLPVGILMAILGVPVFVWLLQK